jgi:hypothetical protein
VRYALAAAVIGCAVSTHAFAEPTDQERVLANVLFDEARRLMAAERFDEACPKFAESQRLQPGGGTLLNLGICHQKQGKTASAWGELKTALAIARRDGRADREAIALEHLAVVEPQLVYLTLGVGEEVSREGLAVMVDGVALSAASWGTAQPVDPGEHLIEARAPAHERFTSRVLVDPTRPRVRVDIPRLAPTPRRPSEPAPEGDGLPGQAIAAIVAAGLGTVSLAFAIGFGVEAAEAWRAAEASCPRPNRCTAEGVAFALDAGRAADLSTSGFVTAGSGLALAAVLLATLPLLSGDDASDRVTLSFAMDATMAGGALSWRVP